MTTPDTAAVRAWARENGHDVADRGRLPVELHAAYLAANGGSAPAVKAAGKPAAKKAPGKVGAKPAAKKAAPAKRAPSAKGAPAARSAKATKAAPEAVTPAAPQPAPADAAPADAVAAAPDDARIAELEQQVDELTARLAAVEATLSQPAPSSAAKPSRFRRRNA